MRAWWCMSSCGPASPAWLSAGECSKGPHLETPRRQEDHRVIYDHHQLSLLVLLPGSDGGVDLFSKDRGSLGGGIPLASGLLLSSGPQPLLLLLCVWLLLNPSLSSWDVQGLGNWLVAGYTLSCLWRTVLCHCSQL